MKLGSIEDLYSIYTTHPSVVTDPRKLKSGDLYFALKGPNFNGNVFAMAALEAGAAYAIVDEEIPNSSAIQDSIIFVEDVLTTLQELATYHRKKLSIPIIGITGTNGKTTLTYVLEALAKADKKYTGVIGTIDCHFGNTKIPAAMTTPESLDLNLNLKQMVDAGVTDCFIEVYKKVHKKDVDTDEKP